jgi:hypothetical protein
LRISLRLIFLPQRNTQSFSKEYAKVEIFTRY